jgi:hypothetical protein
MRYSERQTNRAARDESCGRRDRVDVLSALLDRGAVGTVRRQAGLSNQCSVVWFAKAWVRKNSSRNERAIVSAAERMGIDDESDQVP